MKKALALILAMIMVLSLAACSGPSGDETSTPPTGSGSTTESDQPSTPSKKDSLVVVSATDPTAYVPWDLSNGPSNNDMPVLKNIYETAIKMLPDGSLEPAVATSWDISEDGRDYTLHLRDDVYFSNGDKLTAEDVAFSYDNSAPVSTLWANYESTEIVDEYTVIVHLSEPYAPMLNTLCSHFATILDKAYYEEVGMEGYQTAPIGSGPYVLTEHVSGDHSQLDYNEKYHGEEPVYKHITLKVITDTNTQMVALENGDADVVLNAALAPSMQLDGVNYSYTAAAAATIQALSLNMKYGPTTDINFRKALQCGINRDEINLGVFEGMAVITDVYGTPSFSGYPDAGTYTPVPAYDPDLAKEYLAQSNYNGEEFEIVTVSGTNNELAAQIIQGQLINLGINCTVNAVDASSFFSAVYFGNGAWSSSMRAGTVSTLDMDGVYTLYNSDTTSYLPIEANAHFDELSNTGRSTADEKQRKEIYAEIMSMINGEVWQIPIYCEINIAAFNTEVEGVVPAALPGIYYFSDWT